MSLVGSTKILTVYNGAVPVNELEDDTLVFAWNQETKLAEIDRLVHTSINTEIKQAYEVSFDSGLVVTCSEDQAFHLFRGDRVTVLDILPQQSIRAFSMSEHRDGHIRVHGWVNGNAHHQYVARMVWEYYNGPVPEGIIVHHKDFRKQNNIIENLIAVTNSEHSSIHQSYRRDGGYYKHKNHKVVEIKPVEDIELRYDIYMDMLPTFIIADDEPVSGMASGIVAGA